jgi:hypothetical protein
MVVNNLPVLLIYKGVKFDNKITPVVPAQKVSKYNKNNRGPNEQKKNDVKTTAAILRIRQQGKSQTRTD